MFNLFTIRLYAKLKNKRSSKMNEYYKTITQSSKFDLILNFKKPILF